MSASFVKSVESRLSSMANKNRKVPRFLPADYYNSDDSQMPCYNLKIPQVRAVAKDLFLEFKKKNISLKDQFKNMQDLWFMADSFEARAIALFWLEEQNVDLLVQHAKPIQKWVERINNWAHSDTYSGTLAKIFEADPEKLKTTFENWNKHKNPWKRRNSIVGLMLYARMRKTHPSYEFCLKLVDSQKAAPEYYVQKAYGWTIREMYNVYPEKTMGYIKQNAKIIPPAAWYAATEKLCKSEKAILMKIRKG